MSNSKTQLIVDRDSFPQLVKAYMHCCHKQRTPQVLLTVVTDSTCKAVDFGPTFQWQTGVSARVRSKELKVSETIVSQRMIITLATQIGIAPPCYVDYFTIAASRSSSPRHMVSGSPINFPGMTESGPDAKVTAPQFSLDEFCYSEDWSQRDEDFMNNLVAGAQEAQGIRRSMEDRYTVENNFGDLVRDLARKQLSNLANTSDDGKEFQLSSARQAFYAVYDGHGGFNAAQFCQNYLHVNLARELASIVPSIGIGLELTEAVTAAIKESTQRTEAEFIARAIGDDPIDRSGTTMLMALFRGAQMYIAHAGDCRAVLCRAGVAIDLTRDHTCKNMAEKLRVERMGGIVRHGYINDEIEVSRSIGDITNSNGEKIRGLTAEPEVSQHFITRDDEFVILACDGVISQDLNVSLSSQAAVDHVRRSLMRDNDVEIAARALLQAVLPRSEDNCTCVVIGFGRAREDGEVRVVPRQSTVHTSTKREAVSRAKLVVQLDPRGVEKVQNALDDVESGVRESLAHRQESIRGAPLDSTISFYIPNVRVSPGTSTELSTTGSAPPTPVLTPSTTRWKSSRTLQKEKLEREAREAAIAEQEN
jgi:serine/threonine protein phosphatase PrpC